MSPTQRHSWFARPDNRSARRQADLLWLATDLARRSFDERYGTVTFGPVVALITAYEEERNIGDVLKSMPAFVGDLDVSTLVVVDGGSDGTARVALDSGAYTCVLPVNLGQGAALRLGYALAAERGARYVVTIDADGQNDPAELEGMVQPLVDDEADFVIGSRRLGVDETTDRLRRAGVKVYASAINAIIRQRLTDSSSGYRAFRIELLNDIRPHLVQDQYQTAEVIITSGRRGWRITERPTVWHPRASGTSKKGGNIFFGVQYAKVIIRTWLRTLQKSQPPS